MRDFLCGVAAGFVFPLAFYWAGGSGGWYWVGALVALCLGAFVGQSPRKV